jgi:hypothetical protein
VEVAGHEQVRARFRYRLSCAALGAGSLVNSATVSLVVQPAPNFGVGPAPGQSTSQTISAGQSAKFSLTVTPSGAFSGTVDLSCSIKPVVTPAPTCSLSGSSVKLTGNGSQHVTVTVGTTAPVITGTVFHVGFPPGWMPLAWTVMVPGLGLLFLWVRKRLPIVAALMVVLAVASWVGCGGGSSSPSNTALGTPSGTYAVTIAATSGGLNHNATLTVVVQ